MRNLIVLLIVALASTSSLAQFNVSRKQRSNNTDSNSSSLRDKLYFSCGGGLGTGTNAYGYRYTYYSLLPTIGYRVKPDVLLGINISYSNYSFPDIGASYDQLGGALFARYYIQQLFFQIEYDKISATTYDNRPRNYYDRLLVGAGYVQPIGKRSAINAMALYDVLYQQNGVFQSPLVLRVFFSF